MIGEDLSLYVLYGTQMQEMELIGDFGHLSL